MFCMLGLHSHCITATHLRCALQLNTVARATSMPIRRLGSACAVILVIRSAFEWVGCKKLNKQNLDEEQPIIKMG
jgi:hypothetical protein